MRQFFSAIHVWSYAGESDHRDVSSPLLQQFVNYIWPDSTGVTLNTEGTYDWQANQWIVPLNLSVSRLFTIAEQRLSLQVGARYYAERAEGGPDWGSRFAATFLFPK